MNMKGKIISTVIIIPFTLLVLWAIVSSGLGVFALIMAAIVIIAVFYGLLWIWESNPQAMKPDKNEGK